MGGLLVWARGRAFSGPSAAIFAFTAISAAIALAGSTSPKVLLYKDCATTGLIGLLFLASCVVARKPIVFNLAQRWGTDGSHDGMAVFATMWTTYSDFRRSMYVISYLWAAVFVIQAAVTALLIRTSSYSTGYTYDQVLPWAAVGVGMFASMAVGRYYRNKGMSRGRT